MNRQNIFGIIQCIMTILFCPMEIKSGETDKDSQCGDCGMGVKLEVSLLKF